MSEAWTIRRMLDWMSSYLGDHLDESPEVSARWLVSEACGMGLAEVFMNLERPLSQSELDTLRIWVKRRAQGEPLQLIVGKTRFRFVDIIVAKDVLIPRPETEVLVSEALETLPRYRAQLDFSKACETDAQDGSDSGLESSRMDDPRPGERESRILVVDACTGSGNIACSIAKERPDTVVIATDISAAAIDLASRNAEHLGVAERVEVIECDCLDGIPCEFRGRISLVISNPPYVPKSVLKEIPSEVADFEPMIALDGGESGLDVFERIAEQALELLAPCGVLAVELFEESLEEAANIAARLGYANVRTRKDLAGRDRILLAQKASEQS